MDPNRVLIFDTTLRDGEQSPGISLNTGEKLEIAHQLARLGVDIIEAGFPIASPGRLRGRPGDRPRGPRPRHHRPRAGPRRRRRPCLGGGARRRATSHPHLPVDVGHPHRAPAAVHARGRQGPGPRRGRARAVALRGRRVLADGRDARRRRVHRRGAQHRHRRGRDDDQHARHRRLHDARRVHRLPRRSSTTWSRGCAGVVLSVHCHDDLGLAVANSFAGVQAGARQVECAINGIGERAGNASLEEIVMLLHTRRADVGVHTGIVTTEIARTSRLVSRLTGYPVQPNKAIVGRNAFVHESGIHQDGVLKERSTYEIMDATTVGRRHERDRARQALRPPRAAPGARGARATRSTARS